MGNINWQNPQIPTQNQTQNTTNTQLDPWQSRPLASWWSQYQPGGSKGGGGQYQSSPMAPAAPVTSPGAINYASGTATDSTAVAGTPSIDTSSVVTQPVAAPAVQPAPVAAPVAQAPAAPVQPTFNPYRRTTVFGGGTK